MTGLRIPLRTGILPVLALCACSDLTDYFRDSTSSDRRPLLTLSLFAPAMPVHHFCSTYYGCHDDTLFIRDFSVQDDSILVSADYSEDNFLVGDLYLAASKDTGWRRLEMDRTGQRLAKPFPVIEFLTKIHGRYFISDADPANEGYGSIQTCELASRSCSDMAPFPYRPHEAVYDLGYSQGGYFAVFYPYADGHSFWSMRPLAGEWVKDSLSGLFNALFHDGDDLYLAKGNTVYRRDPDSLLRIAQSPVPIRRFGISGRTLLVLTDSAACVMDMDAGEPQIIPIAVPEGTGNLVGDRSTVQVAGKYLIYGNGSELVVFDPQKRIVKSFRLSEWISDHRWIFRDGKLLSATFHRIVSLPMSEIDAYFE